MILSWTALHIGDGGDGFTLPEGVDGLDPWLLLTAWVVYCSSPV